MGITGGSRVVAVIEAATVTGPAKNLLRFGARARQAAGELAAELSILTFSRSGAATPFQEAVRAAGLEADVVRERFRFDPGVAAQMKAALERRKPDILQTHGVKAHFLVNAGGLARRQPWLAFHHGYTAEDVKMRAYNQLDRWSLPAADRVVTVCTPFAEMLEPRGVRRERIEVLPNSIDPESPPAGEELAALRSEFQLTAGERVILSAGRFSREKAQSDLIEAAAILRRLEPGLRFRLVLAGDGPELPRVRRAAGEAGLSSHVLFPGHRNRLNAFYGVADVFVLPSHSEGSPNVLLEAMMAGTPIVATAVGGVPETVQDGESAILVPPKDPGAMAAAMRRLFSDAALRERLAAAGALRVRTVFSPETYHARLTAIYSRVRAAAAG